MTLASWGRNSSSTRSSIHLHFSSSIRAHTRVLLGKYYWGEITWLECKSGSHLSPRIMIDLPSPILHLEPNLTTLRAFRMLCQTYDPFIFTPSSRIEQQGKYFDLNTLWKKRVFVVEQPPYLFPTWLPWKFQCCVIFKWLYL